MAEPEVPSVASDNPNLPVDPETAPRAAQKIREMELIVAEVIWETADTVTLNLFAGGERMEYQAGQFITIRPQQFPALDESLQILRGHEGEERSRRGPTRCPRRRTRSSSRSR